MNIKVVLGGGISGLAAAHYLLRGFPKHKIVLYETSYRIGGWIESNKLPNGVIFEHGPRTIRPKGESGLNTLKLVDELDISDEIIPITTSHPAAKTRMVFARGKLNVLPSRLTDILKTFPPFQKPLLFHLMQDLFAKRKLAPGNDEPIYNFVERRFGKDIAEYAISPMICGICAGDAKEISVKFLMESLFDKEQKYGSITQGLLVDMFKRNKKKESPDEISNKAKNWSIYSFKNGLETLPLALRDSIVDNGVNIRLNSECNKITFKNNGVVLNINNTTKFADHIISSIPARNLAQLIEHQHPVLANNLKAIPFVTVAVINLHYNKKLPLKEAFGFLVPPSENISILGVIFDSCCFPHSENTVLTVMMGGKWYNAQFGSSPKEDILLNTALDELRYILNIKAKPDNVQISILENCIPQYIVGHKDRMKEIEDYIKQQKLQISLCGSSYYGVGVNDAILSAKNAVKNITHTN